MGGLGFSYDASRCTGCRACQMACKEKNKLPVGDFCRRVDTIESEGKWLHFSLSCNHCEDPACMAVCPTGAMYRAEDGTVQHRDDLCIGCARCVQSCPYGAPFIDSTSGYAAKCDACIARRAEGREPACVEACPMRALSFNEGEDKRGEEWGATLPFLPPEDETHPRLRVRGAKNGRKDEKAGEKTTEHPASAPSSKMDARLVILGSGVAAVSAAKAARARSAHVSVTIISREKRLPYSRPMLSKGLTASFAMDRYPILTEDWLKEQNVLFLGGAEIEAIDAAAHEVSLRDGRKIPYDKCIYALGADCFVPPIHGRELAGVFTLRYDRDLAALRMGMLRAKNAVIVGGGITGLELAWELKRSGLSVTVLDVLERLMDRFIDGRSAALLRERVEASGIEVKTGVQIKAIEGADRAERIVLASGEEIPADIVVLSTGYRPNITIAAAAGLACGRAVTVSERMETSDRDVYACGDCVDRSTATWVQSIRQGAVAAANALGAADAFHMEAEPVMVHTAGTSLLMVGDMGKQSAGEYSFLYGTAVAPKDRFSVNQKEDGETHVALCFCGGQLVGATLLGSISLMLAAQQAVDSRWDADTAKCEFAKKGVSFHEA